MLVLVPRFAAAAGRLDHEHALHALVGAIPERYVGANDVVQDAADAGMGHGVADDRTVDMRLPDVHVAPEEPFVILGPVDRLDSVALGHALNGRVRVVAPIDPPQLTRNLGAGGLVHHFGDQHVPALDVGSPQIRRPRSAPVRNLAIVIDSPPPATTSPCCGSPRRGFGPRRQLPRTRPVRASLRECRRLTGPDSVNDIRHVESAIGGSEIAYRPGDALGVLPCKDAALVDAVLAAAGCVSGEPVEIGGGLRPLREALLHRCDLTRPRAALAERLGHPGRARRPRRACSTCCPPPLARRSRSTCTSTATSGSRTTIGRPS